MKAFGVAAGVVVLLMGLTVQAQAAPIVMVQPVSQTINISNISTVSVDILVTGLTEPIGGYDLTLEWDESIIDWFFIDADPDDNFDNFAFLPTFLPGAVSLFIAGDPVNGNDGSTDPLRIATFRFNVLNVGTTVLDLTFAALSDDEIEPNDIPGVTAQSGIVCVARLGTEGPDAPVLNDPNCTTAVPEPTMLSLLAAGLVTAAVRRRAAKRS